MIYIILILILFLIYILIREDFTLTKIGGVRNSQPIVIQNTLKYNNNITLYPITQNTNEGTLSISFALKTNTTNAISQEILRLNGIYIDSKSVFGVLEILLTEDGGFQINTGYSQETFNTKSYYLTNDVVMILITIQSTTLTISINDNMSYNYIETFNTGYELYSGLSYNIKSIDYGSYNDTISNIIYIFNINLFYTPLEDTFNPPTTILKLNTIRKILPSNNNIFFDEILLLYYYVFKNNTNIIVPANCNLNYLCIGGGGGTGNKGGGGGGSFVSATTFISKGTTIDIIVGKGGTVGVQGGNSSISFTNYNAIAAGGGQGTGTGGNGKQWTNCIISKLRNYWWSGGGSISGTGGKGGGGGATPNGGELATTVYSGDKGTYNGGANTGGGGGGKTGAGGDGIVILIFY
jgi:hypothetical protein